MREEEGVGGLLILGVKMAPDAFQTAVRTSNINFTASNYRISGCGK
jgi:hypothetical protein